jgi:glycosyltransferase involved in cell wall biosynthesis
LSGGQNVMAKRTIKVLRPARPADMISARVFDELFVRELTSELEIVEVDISSWLTGILGEWGTSRDTSNEAKSFRAGTSGFDFLCPDHHAIPLAPICLQLRNRARAPIRLLLIAHAPGVYGLEWVLLRPLLRPGDLIIAPSTSAKDVIVFLCPELASYIRVIPHPIRPLHRGSVSAPDRIVSLCRIHPTKLLHRHIEAVAILAKRATRLPKMQIAGPLRTIGSKDMSPYARSLAAKIVRLGLEDHVELIGEIENNEGKAAFLAGAHLLMNSSVSVEESFGKAGAEALGAGVPVLATRWNGLPELVGQAGECIPVNDETLAMDVNVWQMADALEGMLSAPPPSELCREQARAFHPERVARLYRLALEDALSASWDGPPLADDRVLSAAPASGLLSTAAPLSEFSWNELFDFHVEDVARLHRVLKGEKVQDISNGEHLRTALFQGTRAPLERFLAGLDYSGWMAVSGQQGRGLPSSADFLSRISAAAGTCATRSSRVACTQLLHTSGQPKLLRSALVRMQGEGLQSASIDFLEIELERLEGHHARALQLRIGADDAPLRSEFSVPALRQLSEVCREMGLPGFALPWLREWLDCFPDSPDSGLVWLDRCMNALQTSAELIEEAREAFVRAEDLLGNCVDLTKLQTELARCQ